MSTICSGTLCTCNETRCNSPTKGENFTKEAETAAAVSYMITMVIMLLIMSIMVMIIMRMKVDNEGENFTKTSETAVKKTYIKIQRRRKTCKNTNQNTEESMKTLSKSRILQINHLASKTTAII